MSGVDNRIVTMQFNNAGFERNARTSMSTLAKLKEHLNFGQMVGSSVRALGTIQGALSKIGLKTPFGPMITAANKGLSGIGTIFDKLGMKNPFAPAVNSASELQRAAQTAAGPTGVGAMEGAVTGVSNKFILLSTIAITAISNITNRMVNAGTQWAKSFTVQPIIDGLNEYQTNLKAIQTVQANTDRPLPEINSALEQLNAYSDQTIYNFGEMAKNVGTFTAAGVDLQTSVSAIKGIANMAALSGSNSQQAATAMYQLSQALASGKVGLMDWNSVVNAGMGGKKLQNALAQTAVAMGKLDEAQVKGIKSGEQLKISNQSFRESIMAQPGQESWLTSKILENSLAALDGRFSTAALKAEELKDGTLRYKTAAERTAAIDKARLELAKKGVKYSDKQFEALKKLSNSAYKSATEVKTLGQVFDIARESIGSGWSASFQNIFGNLKQAKTLFTGMSNGLGEIIKGNSRARNELLKAWSGSAIGGRQTLIDGLKNAWEALLDILGPIKEGFRDIFPAKTADNLREMTVNFENFTQKLRPSHETMVQLRDIAGGFAAAFHIVGQVVGAAVDAFKRLFGSMGGGEGKFLSFAGGIGQAVKDFDKFLEKSDVLENFFSGLGGILSVPLNILKGLGNILKGIFGGFDEGTIKKVSTATGKVTERLSGLEAVGKRIGHFFSRLGELFGNIGEKIGGALVGIGDMISKAFTPETFKGTLDVINTSLLGGLVLLIRNFFNKGIKIDIGGGLFGSLKKTLGEVTETFELMQTRLKADILIRIAIAIGVMAAALLVLSTIDPGALTKALAAMGSGFGILITAMSVMMKVMGPVGLGALYVISSSMTKMAAAILLLSLALKTLSKIPFGDMIKGLIGLGGMMVIMSKVMLPMAAGSKGMAKAAWSMILMGVALNLLAVALKIFGSMSWDEMIRGLAGLTGTLIALSIGLKLMPEMKAESIGLIALGVAMNLLAVALKIFGSMSWSEIAKGLFMLAGSMVTIGVAIRTMPKTMMLQAAALVVVAGAITVLTGAMKVLGGMSIGSMIKSLVMLAGTLTILSIGLKSMMFALPGAAALLVAAAALAVMVPVLIALGAMKWESIIKAMVTLAGTFIILGVAGAVLAPVIPVILGLGAAVLMIGAGFFLAGAGALALATAIGVLVGAGAIGVQTLISYLTALIDHIPAAAIAFAQGIVAMAVVLSKNAPVFATTFSRMVNAMLTQAIKMVPKFGKLAFAILNTFLDFFERALPRLTEVGIRMVIHLLEGLARNAPKLMNKATDLAVGFMRALGNNAPRLADAGYKMLIKVVNGISKAIDENSKPLGEAGARLGISIATGMGRGLAGAGGIIKDAAVDAAEKAFKAVKGFFHIGSPSKLMRDEVGKRLPQGMALGIDDDAYLVTDSIGKMGMSAVEKMERTMNGINDSFSLDPNLTPTVTPVLDLSTLTRDASKMSSLLEQAPILPTYSFRTAADISAETQASAQAAAAAAEVAAGGGDTNISLEQHLHSPKPIDSVEAYRGGKTLISLAKEVL